MTALNSPPVSFQAGDSLSWLIESPSLYPAADGWVLHYTLVQKHKKITLDGSPSGDNFQFTQTPEQTALWPAANYGWQSYVTKDGERFTVDHGSIEILADFATATDGLDTRTSAKQMLDKIEAWMKGDKSPAVASYEIMGRKMQNVPSAELLVVRAKLQREVKAEQVAAGLAPRGGNKVQVRF